MPEINQPVNDPPRSPDFIQTGRLESRRVSDATGITVSRNESVATGGTTLHLEIYSTDRSPHLLNTSFSLDCYWAGSLDFNFLGNPKSCHFLQRGVNSNQVVEFQFRREIPLSPHPDSHPRRSRRRGSAEPQLAGLLPECDRLT